jgi:ganglioside-induced differentiation-associated protein 1
MSTLSTPRLYHAASSYYSAIARLALVEAGVAFTSVPLDIHRRMAQFEPDYARLNPNMTVPTLALHDRTVTESRDIVNFAFGAGGDDEATRRWLDVHYAFPIEELTFAWLLRWNPLARRFVPKSLAAARAHLRALATAHPDLKDRYLDRADVFAERRRVFDPTALASLWNQRRRGALELLDRLEVALKDGRSLLVPPTYGPADVVWTVFLARMRFLRLGDEIECRPALARYAASMFARPSFRTADVWDRIKVLGFLRQVL